MITGQTKTVNDPNNYTEITTVTKTTTSTSEMALFYANGNLIKDSYYQESYTETTITTIEKKVSSVFGSFSKHFEISEGIFHDPKFSGYLQKKIP